MKKLTIGWFILIAIIISSCAEREQVKKFPRYVKTYQIHENNIEDYKIFPGEVKEKREVKLSFRIAGPVKKLLAVEGKAVKKGDLVAQIDKRDYQIQLAASKAQFEMAETQYKRFKELRKRKSISESVFEDVETKYKLAKTKYNADKNSLEDTDLLAPFDGYIQNIFIENFETVSAGMPIVTVVDISEKEVEINFPEKYMLLEDNITNIFCEFKNGTTHKIKAEKISIEKKPNMSHLYKVRLKLDKKTDYHVKPGMAVNVFVSFNTKTNTSITVPSNSVFSKDNKTFVWIVKSDNKLYKKQVETGKLFSNAFIEIKSGLNYGEKIVVAGVNSVYEGQEIKVLEK